MQRIFIRLKLINHYSRAPAVLIPVDIGIIINYPSYISVINTIGFETVSNLMAADPA